VPANALGIVGNWYLRTDTSDVHEKTGANAWTLRTNIRGLTGAAGATGATGATGPAGTASGAMMSGATVPAGNLGSQGNWYLNTTNGDVYEKTSGNAWTLRTNMRGPLGPQGDPGPAGPASTVPGPKGDPGTPGAQGAKGDTGAAGTPGATGAAGATGPAGPGVAAGGTTGQVLTKSSAADFATTWAAPAGAGEWTSNAYGIYSTGNRPAWVINDGQTFYDPATLTLGKTTAVSNGVTLGRILLGGAGSYGAVQNNAAGIAFVTDQAWAGNTNNTVYIRLNTGYAGPWALDGLEVNHARSIFSMPLEVGGSVRIGAATSALSGTVQFTGSAFQGYDGAKWVDFAGGGAPAAGLVPTGGTQFQVLTKSSSTDRDVTWYSIVPNGGTTGQVLTKRSTWDQDIAWQTPAVSGWEIGGYPIYPLIPNPTRNVAIWNGGGNYWDAAILWLGQPGALAAGKQLGAIRISASGGWTGSTTYNEPGIQFFSDGLWDSATTCRIWMRFNTGWAGAWGLDGLEIWHGQAVFSHAVAIGPLIDSPARAGTIQFANGRFQGFNGSAWVNLD